MRLLRGFTRGSQRTPASWQGTTYVKGYKRLCASASLKNDMVGSLSKTTNGTGAAKDEPKEPKGATSQWPGISAWLADTKPDNIQEKLHDVRDIFLEYWVEKRRSHKLKDPSIQEQQAVPNKDPLIKEVIKDVVKYGEMVQAVYDTLLTKDKYSKNFGNCLPKAMIPERKLKEFSSYINVGEEAREYKVLTRMQADAGAYKLVANKGGRNYVGFIAQGPGGKDGGVDIAIVFRGTITTGEWITDAKAVQVRWNEGKHTFSPPGNPLSAIPFVSDSRLLLWTFTALQLLAHSDIVSSTWLHYVVGWVVAFSSTWLGSALGLVGGALLSPFIIPGYALYSVLDWMLPPLFDLLFVAPPEVPLVSSSAATALAVYYVWGLFSSWREDPEEYWRNWRKLFQAIGPWLKYGTLSFFDGWFLGKWGDPRVSYGFKEMYCDAREGLKDPNAKPGSLDVRGADFKVLNRISKDGPSASKADSSFTQKTQDTKIDLANPSLPPSPRLTVYETLIELLEDGVKIKSITTTGHSLGGALASLCAFDVARTIDKALKKEENAAMAKGADGKQDSWKTLEEKIEERRNRLIELLQQEGRAKSIAVGAVTFAAPRVGDENYSKSFNHRSLMNPLSVTERWSTDYNPGFGGKFKLFFRDYLWQLLEMPWYGWAKLQIASQGGKVISPAPTP